GLDAIVTWLPGNRSSDLFIFRAERDVAFFVSLLMLSICCSGRAVCVCWTVLVSSTRNHRQTPRFVRLNNMLPRPPGFALLSPCRLRGEANIIVGPFSCTPTITLDVSISESITYPH
ncbi:unnamed protein product, partial [Ectocarpus sp. 12 AP-2014]